MKLKEEEYESEHKHEFIVEEYESEHDPEFRVEEYESEHYEFREEEYESEHEFEFREEECLSEHECELISQLGQLNLDDEDKNEEYDILFDEGGSEEDDIDPELSEDANLEESEYPWKVGTPLRRFPSLFISNILESETVNLPEDSICLKFRNFRFVNAKICGIAVDISLKDSKTTIFVDDNTGVIPCIVEPDINLDNLKNKYFQTMEESNESDSDDELTQASRIMKNVILENLQHFPDFLDFEEGDMVEVTGNFKDYDNQRMCFATSIRKISPLDVEHSINFLKTVKLFHKAIENIKDEF